MDQATANLLVTKLHEIVAEQRKQSAALDNIATALDKIAQKI